MDAVASVEKAVDLLYHLHAAGEPRGARAVAEALGLSRSGAQRLLATLAARGLLERDARGRYRPGLGLVALGLGALEREPLVALARPVLEAEARALGETVFLTAARGGAVVVLDKAEGTGFLRAAPRVGSSVPLHATAAGRLHLAFAPERVAAPAEPFERFTPATPPDAAALARGVARARERGLAESEGEWMPGLAVLAAPVFARGRMEGALAAACGSARMEALRAEGAPARLRAAARRLGRRVEGRDEANERGGAAPAPPGARTEEPA